MAVSSIGAFTFVSLTPHPPEPAEELEVQMRAGKNGAMIWKSGKRPRPFQVTTLRDCVNQADALTALTNYTALIGGAPQTLTYNGATWAYKVVVVRIEPIVVGATVGGVGGVLGSSRGMIRCKWHLLPWVVS